MITKDNFKIGYHSQFGPNWPGKRCCAKTRAGTICSKPAYKSTGRCHNHGGASTGPKTIRGRKHISETQFKHGKHTMKKKLDRKRDASINRKLRYQRKLAEHELKSAGIL